MRKYVLLLALTVPLKVYADCPDGVERCGTTEDGLTWSVSNIKDENGNFIILSNGEIAQELKIEGTGDMQDYERRGENQAPWKDAYNGNEDSAPTITKITVGEGITSIGDRAFEDMMTIKNVSLPEGLKEIGSAVFNCCYALSQINLPNSLEVLESYALYATNISNLILPENLQTIGKRALAYLYALSDITIPEGADINKAAFEKESGDSVIETVYCLGTNPSCQALKNQPSMEGRVQFYEKDGDKIFYQGKWYASSNDFATGNHIKKLRYTVEEAMKATEKGDKFHVFLTYK